MKTTSRSRVYRCVAIRWLHTLVALLVLAGIGFIAVFLGARFLGPKVTMTIITSGFGIGLLAFLLSPLLVQVFTRAVPLDREKYPNVTEAMSELLKGRFVTPPQLYLMQIGSPNACAFGWFLFRGIAVSPELYDLLSSKELKAVLAHEVAHLRSRDVGLATLAALFTGGVEEIGKLLCSGGRGPIGWLLGGLLWVVAKTIVPLVRATLMQQREYVADALGALYCGSPEPLIQALQKLESSKDAQDERNPVSDLFLSHPNMQSRLKALQGLAQ